MLYILTHYEALNIIAITDRYLRDHAATYTKKRNTRTREFKEYLSRELGVCELDSLPQDISEGVESVAKWRILDRMSTRKRLVKERINAIP